jgi:hypothetical protein
MHKILFFVSFSVITSCGFAQVNTSESGPAETFAARKGTILEKRFDEINKIGNLNIQLEYITDLTNRDKLQCVRFDIQPGENVSGSSALLDTNEVNEIISFLVYISNNVTNRPPVDPNTEISFTGKYNMQIGCFWQKNNGWILFLRTDAQNAATESDIPQLQIPVLLKDLNLAKAEIQKN